MINYNSLDKIQQYKIEALPEAKITGLFANEKFDFVKKIKKTYLVKEGSFLWKITGKGKLEPTWADVKKFITA